VPVLIRTAVSADAVEVASLFAAHLAELDLHPDPALDADMTAFPLHYEVPGACFLVAEAPEGALVGMAGLLDGEVRRVFVQPAWRGEGIGRQLITALVDVDVAEGPCRASPGEQASPHAARLPHAPGSGRARLLPSREGRVARPEPRPTGRMADEPGGEAEGTSPKVPDRLWAVVSRGNLASRRLFLACGFVPTGRAPSHPVMGDCEILERSRRSVAGTPLE